jgi:hypothetical protein
MSPKIRLVIGSIALLAGSYLMFQHWTQGQGFSFRYLIMILIGVIYLLLALGAPKE